MTSVLEEIRKLDQQKAQLLDGAKREALAAANLAIKDLAELGFKYRLVAEDSIHDMSGFSIRTGTRRTGIREEVLGYIKLNAGVTRSQLISIMDIKGKKSDEQSLSNALAALKKAGTITAADGAYTAK